MMEKGFQAWEIGSKNKVTKERKSLVSVYAGGLEARLEGQV